MDEHDLRLLIDLVDHTELAASSRVELASPTIAVANPIAPSLSAVLIIALLNPRVG